jgi:hypothetical protein
MTPSHLPFVTILCFLPQVFRPPVAQALADREEDRTLRVVLVGMLRETDGR